MQFSRYASKGSEEPTARDVRPAPGGAGLSKLNDVTRTEVRGWPSVDMDSRRVSCLLPKQSAVQGSHSEELHICRKTPTVA
jgi:hypothetical protein